MPFFVLYLRYEGMHLSVDVFPIEGMPHCRLVVIRGDLSQNKTDVTDALGSIELSECRGVIIDCRDIGTRETWLFDLLVDLRKKLELTKHDIRVVGMQGGTRIAFFNGNYGFDLGFSEDVESAKSMIKTFQVGKGEHRYFQ